MKDLRIVLLVVACGSACTTEDVTQREQASSTDNFQEVFQGGEAVADYADTTTWLHVDVFENRSNQYPGDAFLFYAHSAADPDSFVCNGYCQYTRWFNDYGFGHIPATDAQIGTSEAQLHTSTSVAGFTTQHCIFDATTYTETCGPGIDGPIELSWHVDGRSTSYSSGIFRQTSSAWSYQTQGSYWNSSAQASGSLPGHSIATAYGALNDSRTGTVSKTFTRSH